MMTTIRLPRDGATLAEGETDEEHPERHRRKKEGGTQEAQKVMFQEQAENLKVSLVMTIKVRRGLELARCCLSALCLLYGDCPHVISSFSFV